MEFVVVRHPDIDVPAEVSRDAFDAVYREKGWQIVDEDAPVPADDPDPTDPDEAAQAASADNTPAPSSPQVV